MTFDKKGKEILKILIDRIPKIDETNLKKTFDFKFKTYTSEDIDSNTKFVVGDGGKILILDTDTLEKIKILKYNLKFLTSFKLNNKIYLVSRLRKRRKGKWESKIYIYDIETKIFKEINLENKFVRKAYVHDGEIFLLYEEERTIYLSEFDEGIKKTIELGDLFDLHLMWDETYVKDIYFNENIIVAIMRTQIFLFDYDLKEINMLEIRDVLPEEMDFSEIGYEIKSYGVDQKNNFILILNNVLAKISNKGQLIKSIKISESNVCIRDIFSPENDVIIVKTEFMHFNSLTEFDLENNTAEHSIVISKEKNDESSKQDSKCKLIDVKNEVIMDLNDVKPSSKKIKEGNVEIYGFFKQYLYVGKKYCLPIRKFKYINQIKHICDANIVIVDGYYEDDKVITVINYSKNKTKTLPINSEGKPVVFLNKDQILMLQGNQIKFVM